MPHTSQHTPNYHKHILVLLIVLTLARLAVLLASPMNLHGDEAQYWSWSRDLDWGYFSKPPMIAWLIALTTSFFGHEEWAVRLSSLLLHPVTAYLLFRTGRFLYDGRTGFWAALLYFLMPAVWLSSTIVSTDVPLLLCWIVALNAWAHLRQNPNKRWAIMLGMAIGFGMLSKYAMLFFLPALALCIFIDNKTRQALISRWGVIVLGLALLVLSPNIIWNAANNFATISHTAANANIKGVLFHPLELIEFWSAQLGVFGLLTLPLLILALWFSLRKQLGKEAFLLSLFVLSPLLIISAEALLSRANANWAVTAYIGGALLTARLITETFKQKPVWNKIAWVSIGVNILLGITYIATALMPSFADKIGTANAFKRLRGWPQTEQIITNLAQQGHAGQAFIAIATDNRLAFYDLIYYGLEENTSLTLRMWKHTANTHNHAEATAPLTATRNADGPVLIINVYEDYQDELLEDFQKLVPLPPVEVALGGGKTRRLRMWVGYGYTPTHKLKR